MEINRTILHFGCDLKIEQLNKLIKEQNLNLLS